MPFFDPLTLLVTERSIRVDTHLGNPIKNVVAPPAGEKSARLYDGWRAKHGARWQHRRRACGRYNCWGHLFTSRRTAIYEDQEVARALREDGYRRIPEPDARPGDIVLYKSKDAGLLHGGQVVRLERIVPGAATVPVILSKWNDTFGEDEHVLRDVPYCQDVESCDVEVWTDRYHEIALGS